MSQYEIRLTKEAVKDIKKLPAYLRIKLETLLNETIAINPYAGKKLVGDLQGFLSFRLSYKDRIIYSVDEEQRIIFIHRTRTHYGD